MRGSSDSSVNASKAWRVSNTVFQPYVVFASVNKSRLSSLQPPSDWLVKNWHRPPPNIKSTVRPRGFSPTCWRAMSFSQSLHATCAEKAAGVACVTREVTTKPVNIFLWILADSKTVPQGDSSGSTDGEANIVTQCCFDERCMNKQFPHSPPMAPL